METDLNKLAMRFAVVRFMPYVQTREFANVGIILICPRTGFFNYKLENKYQRLSRFFKYFDAKVYKQAIQSFSDELERIKNTLESSSNKNPEMLRALFDHLARPRDAIICTSDICVTTGINELNELDRLFSYFAEHSFAKEQHEELLTKQIQNMIKDIQTAFPFVQTKIGGAEYCANFPMVQKQEDKISKIIKPLYLGQNNSSDIIQKSDKWISIINRLRAFSSIEQDTKIMFPFESAQNQSAAQKKALDLIINDTRNAGIELVNKDDTAEIKRFALS
jgi:hypothetical protein